MGVIKRYAPEIGPGFTTLAPGQSALAGTLSASAIQLTTLTAAQIKAMSATPVAVTPVPGTGEAIIVEMILVELTLTATAFANGGAVQFQYHGHTVEQMSAQIAAATVNGGAGTTTWMLQPADTAGGNVVTPAVAVEITNLTAPFITGTGTAKVWVLYCTLTL